MASGLRPKIKVEGKTIREISAETGIREATLRARIFPGCTIKDITGRRQDGRNGDVILVDGMTLCEIAKVTGISYDTLYWRYKHGRTDFGSLTAGRYGLRVPHRNGGER